MKKSPDDITRMMTHVVAGGMLCLPRVLNLSTLLLSTENLPGAVCEFGCHRGGTAVLMSALSDKDPIWLYDSFQGLPEKRPEDVTRPDFVPGYLKCPEEAVFFHFKCEQLPPPKVFPDWFKDLTPDQLPKQIAFAHIDGDFHASITDALKLVWPRLVRGGVCVVDDYDNPILQGVKPAVLQFLGTLEVNEYDFQVTVPNRQLAITNLL